MTSPLLPQPPGGADVVRSTLVSGVQQVLAVGVGLVLLPYMLSRMGVERYGYLVLVQVFSISGVLAYADGGLQNAFTRHMAAAHARGDTPEVRTLFVTTLATFLAIGAVSGLAVWACARFAFGRFFDVPAGHLYETRTSLYVYAATLLFQFPVLGLKAFYAAVQDVVTLKIWEIVSRLLYAVVIVVVLLRVQDVLSVVVAEQAVAAATFVGFLAIAARRHAGLLTLRPALASWQRLREVAPYAAHVFANYASTYGVFHKLPEIFVARYLGPVAVAHYSIISRIPRMIKTLSAASNAAAAPVAAALDGIAAHGKLGDLVLRGARYSYALLTPIVVFIVVFAEAILRTWVGETFVPLANLLRVFVVWQYLMFLVFYTNATLTRTNQYRQLLPYSLAANIAFVGLMRLTIERAGLWSIVAPMLVGLVILVAGSIAVQRRTHEVSYRHVYQVVFRMPIVYTGGLALLLCLLARTLLTPHGLVELGVLAAVFYLVHLVAVFRFGLAGVEREQLARLVRRAVSG